ncbi:MAG: hypothetical protein KJ731_16425 [Alphaproteobacteria bacterium]|nr:hypothetical protein [Alphaproteobacteria bacterium]MBU1278481.1 hypothetical protein [Alphaproteobacteria bacterium]MBU1573334.1 hypothetical protein [Alphaproteobacteria bacterium]MBU1830034.1 hypothetical protein [Alphaproteobacteria bacterium]MBU2241227.1 hypothetical protein [Alphaproteobacteria bacterium]
MSYSSSYRDYSIYLDEKEEISQRRVHWKVIGYGSERASGVATSNQEAYQNACGAIDAIQDDPYRFPVNLVGYSKQSEGEVITQDSELLGRWRMSDCVELDIVEFIPEGSQEVLFSDHFIGILCNTIRAWHESSGSKEQSVQST